MALAVTFRTRRRTAVELHRQRNRVRTELHTRRSQCIGGLERMPALYGSLTALTGADAHIKRRTIGCTGGTSS
jgi:hypothetical protein